MSFSYDRTGFPLFAVPDMAIEVHLLPVTKVQFERFVAEAGNNWPGAVKAAEWSQDAGVSYDRFAADEREKLFMTGILPEEAVAFAGWMGEGFDLPTLDEWRAIYRALEKEPVSLCQPVLQSAADPACIILDRLLVQTQARSLLDLSLMRGGILEWVRQGDDAWLGRGQPRHEFYPNLFDPLSDRDDQVRPIQMRRSRYFGFRLVRRNGRPMIEMPANVQAGQHIYTSVEKAQSPHNKEGFQTLFYTTSLLTENEAEEIEARLLYFLSEIEPIDRIFFKLSSGKIVVTQIVLLAEPDRFGRRGRYLAHSLVFAPGAFAQLGADPFQVFERFPFFINVEEALKSADAQTGDIGIVVREVSVDPSHNIEAAMAWPAVELRKLALLALRAGQLARERLAVAFVGEPELVEEALKAAFLAVPTPLRPRCTFDTYFYRCNLMNTYCWAVGLLESPNDPRFTVVDVGSRRVLGEAAIQPQTAYEQWVVDQLEPEANAMRSDTDQPEVETLNLVAYSKDYAFALCEWLDDRVTSDTPLVEEAPSEIIESTFRVNAQRVQTLLHSKLLEERQLPPRLVNRVSEQVYKRMRAIEHYRRLRRGFELFQLSGMLYEVYKAQEFQAPQREEVQELRAILEKVDHRALRALYAYWTNQRRRLYQELKRLSEDEYRQFTQIALRAGLIDDPLVFLIPVRGDVFLDLYLGSGMFREHNLVALVRTLLAAREVNCLSRLAPYVSGLPAMDLRYLQRVIKRRQDIPQSFQQAVNKAITAMPPERAPRGFLRSLLGLPDEDREDAGREDAAARTRATKDREDEGE